MKEICFEETLVLSMAEWIVNLNTTSYKGKSKEVWVNGDEAMGLLRINSKTTLQKYRDENKIIYSKLSDKHIIYNVESINSFIQKNISKPYGI